MMIDLERYRQSPLYLTDLQQWISALPPDRRGLLRLLLTVDGAGRYRRLDVPMPDGALLAEQPDLFERYLLAMMNNLLVSFGGVRLELWFDRGDAALEALCRRAVERFDLDAPNNYRKGYGVYINYISRMNRFLGLGRFSMALRELAGWREPDPAQEYRVYSPVDQREGMALLRRAATDLQGKCICALDVGGNSIKAAVVDDGEIALLKEHRWYPTGCATAEEMNAPIRWMLRLMGDCVSRLRGGGKRESLDGALASMDSASGLLETARELEALGAGAEGVFDAVVIGFPDIVVHGKVAGGESFKHQGLKNNPHTEYEEEFLKTSPLDELARPFLKPDGVAVVLNDGNAASFVTSVEQAFSGDGLIDENGMFANTIGTEMGTGFISRTGSILHLPLEDFQHVVDLGSTDYGEYPADDVRSTRNMNTGIPGTIQKFVTQLGLFRLAVTGLLERDPATAGRLLEQGLLRWEGGMLRVPVRPADRRGALTRELAALLEQGSPVVRDAFSVMGKAMGVMIDQDRLIFPEITSTRLVSGGIVAADSTFAALQKAMAAHNAAYRLVRLDEDTVASPLLRKMTPEQRSFTVAVGSAYIGNRFLLERE